MTNKYMSTFSALIFVDASGNIYGASKTDQAGKKKLDNNNRTVGGRSVAFAGRWYGSQINYRPFRAAVEVARLRAAEKV